jgi:hypothetical protein
MTTSTKSLILLAFTLMVGFSLGLFADATLVRGRRDRIDRMRRPPGLVEHLESVIQPHSSAQADSIRPVLQALADGNQRIVRETNDHIRARMDSLNTKLSPMLDSAQKGRLAAELQRMPQGFGRGGRGRRGGGPPPGGPPPGR